MRRPLILFFVFFFLASAHAQRIYYSKTEGNFFYTQTHIIGQVKDHIIVWKYEAEKPTRSQILIYDDRMHLLHRVKTGILRLHDLYTTDFVNMGESFAMVHQYKSQSVLFCQIACFDENGHCFNIQTVDSVSIVRAGTDNSFYTVVPSRNKKNFALVKTPIVKNKNALSLQYCLLNSTGTVIQRASAMLPVNDLQLNDLFLDNGNNLIVPMSKNSETYSLMLYKINLETGGVLNVIREISGGYLANNTISISEERKNYFVTAQWRSRIAEDSAAGSNETGLFFWKLNTDLSDASNDTVFTGASMSDQFFSKETYFKSSSMVLQDDAVYIISAPNYTASITNYNMDNTTNILPPTLPALNETYVNPAGGHTGPYSFYDGHIASVSFNIKTLNGVAILNNVDPNDNKLPSLSSLTGSYLRGNTMTMNNFQFVKTADLKLFVVKLDKNNAIAWTKSFDGASKEGLTSFVNLSKILTGNKILSLLYSVSPEKEKQILEKVEFNPDGGINTEHVFSMHLEYNLIFQKGVILNSSTLLFPCAIKNKLAFAKLETE